MRGARTCAAALALGLALAPGCRDIGPGRDRAALPTAAPAAAPGAAGTATAGGAGPADRAGSGTAMKPVAPKDRPILVGGCGDRCRDGRSAAAGFLAATARAAERPEDVVPFLDTTRLVRDGEALGSRWAAQWQELKSATRSAEIRDAARDLGDWASGLDPALVRDVLAAGPRPLREWSTEAVFEVPVPGRAPWRVKVAPRGLEWLVVEVLRGETPGAARGDP